MGRKERQQMAAAKKAKLYTEWAGLSPKFIRKAALELAAENPQEVALVQEVINTLVAARVMGKFDVRYYRDKPQTKPQKSVEQSEGIKPQFKDRKPRKRLAGANKEA